VVGSARVHTRAGGVVRGPTTLAPAGGLGLAISIVRQGDINRTAGHRSRATAPAAGHWAPRIMATPRMPSLIPRRPGLVHYAFAAAIGWATSYYTFQPLLEQQVRHRVGSAMPAVLLPAVSKQTAAPCLPGWLAGWPYTDICFASAVQALKRKAGRVKQHQTETTPAAEPPAKE
jgi:hypothetical protein